MYEKKDDLEILAKALLEYETLSGDEIKELLKGNQPTRFSTNNEKTTDNSKERKAGFGSIIKNKTKKDLK